ncbi:RNA polymerase sigma factor [Actinomadura rupiterrae]|uniref:RNA polymerase sigma factor n=1 Tax=Actinomadura rupiterrae TaxID=559627 RepID=UPI0020A43802|nr:RNA polymerase sigma factor [Actinomadura rupiterrae]MCP2342363.1 RNA polymerase sigma-70 factor (ECF subfamily) [Actinomadura rupiterrae]
MTAPPEAGEVVGDAGLVASSVHEPEGFALVYDRYFDDIHRYLAARLGRETADDLAAETFLIAFRRRADFDPSRGSSVRPWLYGIATNLVSHHRRTEQRRLKAMSRMDAEYAIDGHEERVTARVAAETLRPDLVKAMRALSPGERDVVFLSALGGLGYEDIAQALGIPTGTVGSRLNRARARLRRALGDQTLRSEEA